MKTRRHGGEFEENVRASHYKAPIVIVGYSQRPGAVDEENGWDLVIYHLSLEGAPISSHRFGGEGFEFGRSVAGEDKDLWIVGVLLVRMDFSAGARGK